MKKKSFLDTDIEKLMETLKNKFPNEASKGYLMTHERLVQAGYDPSDLDIEATLSEAEATNEDLIGIVKLQINAFRLNRRKDLTIFFAIHHTKKIMIRRGIELPELNDFISRYPFTLRTVLKIMIRLI